MAQIIDMGGFKNEEIEVVFAGETYKIQLDPPIEIYRQVLSMQGTKLKTEEDWNKFKGIVTDIIYQNNPELDKDKFIKSLTKVSAARFMNAYTDLLFKVSGQKNSQSPLSESKEEKK
jgi:hypothetical protein